MIQKLKDIKDEIKYFIQRGKRGYSDRDCWDVDTYLAKIIPPMVKSLSMGCPVDLDEETWEEYKNEIIWTFETARKIQEDFWIYSPTYKYNDEELVELRERLRKLDYTHVMSLLECIRYERGWRYFQEYFFSLWD